MLESLISHARYNQGRRRKYGRDKINNLNELQ
jgi:hypothetical protein